MSSDELIDDTEFLQREQELMGDEFKTEQDNELLFDQDLEPEEEEEQQQQQQEHVDHHEDTVVEESSPVNKDTSVNEASVMNSQADQIVSEWKSKFEQDILERDKKTQSEKEELQKSAMQFIDEFYDHYNSTKQDKLQKTKLQNDKFIEERDSFLQQDNTIWDRAIQLINLDDSDVVGGRDRSKFKQILLKLKGNTNAPGVN